LNIKSNFPKLHGLKTKAAKGTVFLYNHRRKDTKQVLRTQMT